MAFGRLSGAASLFAALALAGACDGGGNPSSPSPTTVPPTPIETRPAASVTLGGRAVVHGAYNDDSLASLAVGDFNGDGEPDLAAASAQAAGPDGARPASGEAYVFYGAFAEGEERDAGSGQRDVTIYGAGAGDTTGRALAAGDLNGDGVDDLVLGVPSRDGPGGTRADAGAAIAVFGSSSLPPAIDLAEGGADLTVHGADAGDMAGFSLAVADVSGDGVGDLIVSSFWGDGPENGREQAGEVYVVRGSGRVPAEIDLAETRADAVVYGARAGDSLGEVVGAGDVSGDGVDDLVLPAPFASRLAGETYVIAGGPSLPSEIDLAEEEQPVALGLGEGDQLGHSLAAADVDGDSFADLLLGAVSADGPDDERGLAGEAVLVPGAALPGGRFGALREGAIRFYGARGGDRLGRAVALGDLNGDRLADLVLAAPRSAGPEGERPNAGTLYVFFAPELPGEVIDLRSTEADLTLAGEAGGDVLGEGTYGRPSVLVADMNQDGLGDIVVSSPGADGPSGGRADAGAVSVIFLREE